MIDVLLLIGALFAILVLGARWNLSSAGGGREPRTSADDAAVLEELLASGHPVQTCIRLQGGDEERITAHQFEEVRAEIRLLQARVLGSNGTEASSEQARLKVALVGLMDQLADLSRSSGNDRADRLRFERIKSEVDRLVLLSARPSQPPATLQT